MTFTENEIFTYVLLGILALIGLVFVIKMKIKQKATRFSQQYKTANNSIKIKKYPIANIFQFRNIFFRVGLICSLSCVVLAFNWTLPPEVIDEDLLVIDIYDDDGYPWGYPPVPGPPPAPALTIEIVPNETIMEGTDFENIAFDKDGLFESELFFNKKESHSARYLMKMPPPPIEIKDTFDIDLEEEIEFEELIEEEEEDDLDLFIRIVPVLSILI